MLRASMLILFLVSFTSCVSTCEKDTAAKEVVGQMIPKLSLPTTEGKKLRLPEDLLGSYTVLFFYPKDQTPGCTEEASTFRDNLSRFGDVNAKVYGISIDSIDSHHDFVEKLQLNFPLISDEKKELATALNVSSTLEKFSRDTILVDPTGRVAAVWRKVDARETVFETLRELNKAKTAFH